MSPGSPPRMRGKVAAVCASCMSVRITPAHAGKRVAPLHKHFVGWDHPRACGEKRLRPLMRTPSLGSPPRMRGKVSRANFRTWEVGITPAHAGKSSPPRDVQRPCKDHPRACGEKNSTASTAWQRAGSPPRMRGKGLGFGLDGGNARITPAHAGKSIHARLPLEVYRDHPRACGEK